MGAEHSSNKRNRRKKDTVDRSKSVDDLHFTEISKPSRIVDSGNNGLRTSRDIPARIPRHSAESFNLVGKSSSLTNMSSLRSARLQSIPKPISTSPSREFVSIVVALYEYSSQTGADMGFQKGDKFRILNCTDSSWWEAERITPRESEGQHGWIPSNYLAPIHSLLIYPWFHGRISRYAAEHMLSSGINGSFLVRESESNPGEYSISLRYDGSIFHYRVRLSANRFFVTEEFVFPELSLLVDHHSKRPDGLITTLKYPVQNSTAPAVQGISPEALLLADCEVDRSEIQLGHKLGSGQYGEVYTGFWRNSTPVAVKTLKTEQMSTAEFLAEAAIMKKMQHPHLVSLLGVCATSPPFYIITELMDKGCLLAYLRSPEGNAATAPQLMTMASQAASGMAYLESKNLIHRDLAARNCLLAKDLSLKVGDYGLAREVTDEYVAREGTKFPIKWTAPEALKFNTFSIKSDVWAFGILLWELATHGESPYPGIDMHDVLGLLENEYRMECPDICPPEVYAVMLNCWGWTPSLRPSFSELHRKLENLFPNGDVELHVTRARRVSISVKAGVIPPALPTKRINGSIKSYEESVSDSGADAIPASEVNPEDKPCKSMLPPPTKPKPKPKPKPES